MQRRITKDLLTYLPGKMLPALAAFLTVPIYTRLFSPAEFGDYVLAAAAAEFLLLATITGFSQGAVRFFSNYQRRSALPSYFTVVLGSAGLTTLVTAAACSGVLLILRPLIPSDLYPLLWAAIGLYVATALFTTLMDILRGEEQSKWYSIFSVGQAYGAIVFGLLFVLVCDMGIEGLIWGGAASLLLPVIPLLWLVTRPVALRPADVAHPARADRSDFAQLWRFAWPVTLGNIAFWVLSLSDRYIVEMYRGSYEVGLYSVAGKISARSIQLLASLFFLVPAPIISRLWEERGRQATEEALTTFTRMFFLMLIPAVAGIAAVAAPLVRLLADEAYIDSYRAVLLVAYAAMALGLSDLASLGCMVNNRTRLIARNQGLAAGLALILNFIFVPRLGFMGAGLSAAIAFTILAGLQASSSARFLTWRWPLRSLWRVLAASAAMLASVLLVRAGLRPDTTVEQAGTLLLCVTVGGLVYGAALWVLGEISPKQLLGLLGIDRKRSLTGAVAGESGQE
jgi:O-antigen/teichoic acid export membrane protein